MFYDGIIHLELHFADSGERPQGHRDIDRSLRMLKSQMFRMFELEKETNAVLSPLILSYLSFSILGGKH